MRGAPRTPRAARRHCVPGMASLCSRFVPERENARGGAAAVDLGALALVLGGGAVSLKGASRVLHSLECRGVLVSSSSSSVPLGTHMWEFRVVG